ncbi:MAG TPA: helix-turn-helix transcriptional regulator [Actinomycetota bacterium]|nr:helix-turn-helix transcriptional regulator [Actinomycetota bacterium]
MNPVRIGPVVERLRVEAGLTQTELARRVRTTQAAISKIETGRTVPGLDMLDRIAVALGRPITVTLGERPERPPLEERRRRVKRALGDYEFDPWERDPTRAEQESLLRDGLTRERFAR